MKSLSPHSATEKYFRVERQSPTDKYFKNYNSSHDNRSNNLESEKQLSFTGAGITESNQSSISSYRPTNDNPAVTLFLVFIFDYSDLIFYQFNFFVYLKYEFVGSSAWYFQIVQALLTKIWGRF